MSGKLKLILFLVFFVFFFEAGLFASYTIVTQQPPDPGELFEMQVSAIGSIFNFGGPKIPTQKTLNITNSNEVADALKAASGVNGINLQSIQATTLDSTSKDTVTVNITATGYKDSQSGGGVGNKTSGAIVIKNNETYSITATATAKIKTNGVEVDITTIQLTSTRKLYNN